MSNTLENFNDEFDDILAAYGESQYSREPFSCRAQEYQKVKAYFKEVVDKKDAEIRSLTVAAASYHWITNGKRGMRIWNHVLNDSEKEGFNYLDEVVQAGLKANIR